MSAGRGVLSDTSRGDPSRGRQRIDRLPAPLTLMRWLMWALVLLALGANLYLKHHGHAVWMNAPRG